MKLAYVSQVLYSIKHSVYSFLENVLMKFIEALNDFEIVEEKLYSVIKYGTENEYLITMIENGIDLQTAKSILDKYDNYVQVDKKIIPFYRSQNY